MRRAWICLLWVALFLARPVLAQPWSAPYGGCADYYRPLFLANPCLRGPDVAELQERLLELGFYRGPVNGAYDYATMAAVKRLQKACGAPVTGRVELATYRLLGREPERPATAAAKHSPEGKIHLLIDTGKRTLTVFSDGRPFKTYPVCVGKPETPTPVGEWRVVYKATNWGGGFGTRWLGLNVPWGIYGIHGTNKPWSIGQAQSHGCIRLYNRDVEELFPWVPVGTPVKIVGRPEMPPGVRPRHLKAGTNGPDVVQVQLRLKHLGLYWGMADGRYGRLTALAVAYWQHLQGFPATGELEPKMLERLHVHFPQ